MKMSESGHSSEGDIITGFKSYDVKSISTNLNKHKSLKLHQFLMPGMAHSLASSLIYFNSLPEFNLLKQGLPSRLIYLVVSNIDFSFL